MPRQEVTFERDLKFSQWIRKHCPESHSIPDPFHVTDIDFVFYRVTSGRIMLLEVKLHGKEIRPSQKRIYKILDAALRNAKDIDYRGMHVVQFLGDSCVFECVNGSGKRYTTCLFDETPVTEAELRKILSMGK
jgi:hypothetical protein